MPVGCLKVLAAVRPPDNLGAFLIPLLTRVRQISTSVPLAGTREPAGEKEPKKEEREREGKGEKEQSIRHYSIRRKGDYVLCNKSLLHQGPAYCIYKNRVSS